VVRTRNMIVSRPSELTTQAAPDVCAASIGPPRTAFFELLYGCNYFCRYCYVGEEFNHRTPNVPPLDAVVRMLGVLKDEGVQEVVLVGGEPFLYRGFEEVCDAMGRLDFESRGVLSNGFALSDSHRDALVRNGFWADVTLRGDDTGAFDRITRVNGSFEKARDTLTKLCTAGIRTGIEYDCLLPSYQQLYRAVSLVVAGGVKIAQVQLHRIQPSGDATSRMAEFDLTVDQWRDVFRQALRIQSELGIRVAFEDGFPFCLVDRACWPMIAACGCGFTSITVSPSGDLRYCACSSGVNGNLLTSPREELWRRGMGEYRAARKFPEACRKCDLIKACRGGCSASSRSADRLEDRFSHLFTPQRIAKHDQAVPRIVYSQSLPVDMG